MLRTRDKKYKLPSRVNLLETVKWDAIGTKAHSTYSDNVLARWQRKLCSFLNCWNGNFEELLFVLIDQSIFGRQKSVQRLAIAQPFFIQCRSKLHRNNRRFCNYGFPIEQSSSVYLPNWKSICEFQVGGNGCAGNCSFDRHKFSCESASLLRARKGLKQITGASWGGQDAILGHKGSYALLPLNSASALEFIHSSANRDQTKSRLVGKFCRSWQTIAWLQVLIRNDAQDQVFHDLVTQLRTRFGHERKGIRFCIPITPDLIKAFNLNMNRVAI